MMGGPACGSRRSGRCWRCRSGSGCSCLGVGAVLSSSNFAVRFLGDVQTPGQDLLTTTTTTTTTLAFAIIIIIEIAQNTNSLLSLRLIPLTAD